MYNRVSNVQQIYINIVAFGSVFQVGDSQEIVPFSRALAVHRQFEIFFGDEGDFSQFSIFQQPIPLPTVTEDINTNFFYTQPNINVRSIRSYGVTAASVVHIGSTNLVQAESRIKHIRQLSESALKSQD